jgi:hypothetical protein
MPVHVIFLEPVSAVDTRAAEIQAENPVIAAYLMSHDIRHGWTMPRPRGPSGSIAMPVRLRIPAWELRIIT